MKKLMSFAIALAFSVTALAGNPFSIKSGKSILKEVMKDDAKVQLVIDWTNATFDGKEDLKTKWGNDYDYIVSDCEKSLVLGFNDKAKTLNLSSVADGAKYKFVFEVSKVDSYFAAMRFIPQHEGKVWGTIKIVSAETNETLVEIKVDEAEDGADFNVNECYGETFGKLGERLAKLK